MDDKNKRRKVGDNDPKPPAVLLNLLASAAPSEKYIELTALQADELWKNDLWKWYLSYRLSQDGVYLKIIK